MRKQWICLTVVVLFLAACGGGDSEEAAISDVSGAAAYQPNQPDANVFYDEQPVDTLTEDTTQTVERVILKTASLRLVVENPSERANEISAEVEELGGWVVSLNTTQFTNNAGETDTRADITVRVPAEQLTQTLESFQKDAIQVLGQNISGQDVTQEYVDLQSRLTNLETAESQYQSFMEDAQNVTEVTTIYNELIRVREEIEVIEGRIRYYDESASYSSVTVELYPPDAEVEIASTDDSWKPTNTAENAVNALGETLEFLGSVVIWGVVYLLPLALLFALPLAGAYYLFRRVRQPYQRS